MFVYRCLIFGDWRLATALFAGFMAKESVVSTLSVLYGSTDLLLSSITPLAAAAFLVFCLLYTPCVAAVASIKQELGTKWAAIVVILQCIIAWICAFIVRMIGLLLGFV
jgi:ferrous iron transport protein B